MGNNGCAALIQNGSATVSFSLALLARWGVGSGTEVLCVTRCADR